MCKVLKFAYKAYCFFDVLVAVHVVGSEVPIPLFLLERRLLFTAVTFNNIDFKKLFK